VLILVAGCAGLVRGSAVVCATTATPPSALLPYITGPPCFHDSFGQCEHVQRGVSIVRQGTNSLLAKYGAEAYRQPFSWTCKISLNEYPQIQVFPLGAYLGGAMGAAPSHTQGRSVPPITDTGRSVRLPRWKLLGYGTGQHRSYGSFRRRSAWRNAKAEVATASAPVLLDQSTPRTLASTKRQLELETRRGLGLITWTSNREPLTLTDHHQLRRCGGGRGLYEERFDAEGQPWVRPGASSSFKSQCRTVLSLVQRSPGPGRQLRQ